MTLLDYAETHPRANGEEVRALFGMSLTRYYQALTQAIHDPETWRDYPVLVKRELAREERGRRRRERRAFAHILPTTV